MNNSDIKKLLYHPKTNKYHFLAQIKAESNYESFNKKKSAIKSHPFGKQALKSTPLPQTFNQLRTNNIIPHSGNLESELAWTMDSIKENAQLVNRFIQLKLEFENNILLSNTQKAEELLNKIESEICVSNWGVECSFILAEENGGTERNWLLLKEYSTKLKDSLSLFMAEQSSKKSEEKLSYNRYKKNFENITSGVNGLLNEYLCYKILYPGYTGFQNFSFLVNVESVSAVIDRYLLLIDILTEIVLKEKQELVRIITSELELIIPNDNRINQLKVLCNGFDIKFNENHGLISYINAYTAGRYDYCIENATQILTNYPSSIEAYLIYVKALIEINHEFKPLGVSKNIDKILERLFNVYSKNEKYDTSVEDLLKISLKYFSFKFGKQLFSIISRIVNLKDEIGVHKLLYSINSDFLNPIIFFDSNYFNEEIKSNIWNNSKHVKNSISIELNQLISKGKYNEIISNLSFSQSRKPLYIAKALKNTNDNQKVIEFIVSIDDFDSLSTNTQWELIEILFISYLLVNDISSALALYVEYYFKNKFVIANLDANDLLHKVQNCKTELNGIDLPIFYNIVSPDIYEQFVKYDEFIDSIGIERPTQIISYKDIPKHKLVFFLKEVCSIEVLHHSLHFDGTDDIENERTNILLNLLVLDPEFETEYIKEITEISQRSKIRKAIREVNKGRITINTQLLRSNVENEIKDNFLRFRELVDFSEEHKLQSIDPTSKLLNNYFNSIQEKALRDRYVNISDPAFISFKTMIIDIRDKFILSKDFGLDGYLSTRIRHGTFLNHIRSNFESFNLINQKKEDEYIENEFWNKVLPLNLYDKKESIQLAIKNFSKQIDDLTEYIIKDLIQIKTEKHTQKNNALFNYSLTDNTLAYLYSEIKSNLNSHTFFLNFVFEYLEASTKLQLEKIRELFRKDINEKFTDIIKQFDSSIREIIGCNSFVDLTSSITKCQTNIQNEILNISEWFSIANPSSELILEIETIIKTAIEITNTIYPNQTIAPKIIVDDNIPFASGTTNMIYIIRILLDNIIKHSGLPISERNIIIEAKLIDETSYSITVSNDFRAELYESINSNLSVNKQKWNEKKGDFAKSNIEGGSGFDKIRRILEVDMHMSKYKFDYNITQERLSIELIIQIKILSTENE